MKTKTVETPVLHDNQSTIFRLFESESERSKPYVCAKILRWYYNIPEGAKIVICAARGAKPFKSASKFTVTSTERKIQYKHDNKAFVARSGRIDNNKRGHFITNALGDFLENKLGMTEKGDSCWWWVEIVGN